MISRNYKQQIERILCDEKAVMLLGPRQVGKTTLLLELVEERKGEVLFLDCDEPDIRNLLTEATSTSLKHLIGEHKLVIIDEAQRVRNIGLTLKLITDKLKYVRLIISGSSALELSSEISEPLTGRKVEIIMLGLSISEMLQEHGELTERRLLEERMIFGMYPEVVTHPGRAEIQLSELANGYIYKDIFNYQDIRKPELLPGLLEAIARQMGSEVSYNELAQLLSSDPSTISRYINLLEKTMVVFRLRSFSRNLRNELKKSRKIYFYDNGIRNAIINDFRPLELRTDVGALWENFMISERFKFNMQEERNVKSYFWRTKQQQEIDLIEERNGEIDIFEFKYNGKKEANYSKTFTNTYDVSESKTITSLNYLEFLSKN